MSIRKGVFPDDDENNLENYRPISVLPCFLKILERIVYDWLYELLNTNNILCKNKFGFQKEHSNEHAILQLVDQISNSFEKNLFTLGVFIDLSKTFDTVDHDILICKLKNYVARGKNLKLFESYLNNRK